MAPVRIRVAPLSFFFFLGGGGGGDLFIFAFYCQAQAGFGC